MRALTELKGTSLVQYTFRAASSSQLAGQQTCPDPRFKTALT